MHNAEIKQPESDKEKIKKLQEKRDSIFSSFDAGDIMKSKSGTERIFVRYTDEERKKAEFRLRTKWDNDKQEEELPLQELEKEQLNIESLAGIDREKNSRKNIIDQYNLIEGDTIVSLPRDNGIKKERKIVAIFRGSSEDPKERITFEIIINGESTGTIESVEKEAVKAELFKKIIKSNGEEIELLPS